MVRLLQLRAVMYAIVLLFCLYLGYVALHWLMFHQNALSLLGWLKPLARGHFAAPRVNAFAQLAIAAIAGLYFAFRFWMTVRRR